MAPDASKNALILDTLRALTALNVYLQCRTLIKDAAGYRGAGTSERGDDSYLVQ